MDGKAWIFLSLHGNNMADGSIESGGCGSSTPASGTDSSGWTSIGRNFDETQDVVCSWSSSYTSFTEVSDCLSSSSSESLHDWERLSDCEEDYVEERCHSLPGCGNTSDRPSLERSNTVWYARLDSNQNAESKDFNLKTKAISAWTNVTNGWVLKTSTSFKHDSPIWMLGRKYSSNELPGQDWKTSFTKFKLDFYSRIWLTYRVNFPNLPGSQLTSDVGWGCMLRTGQMMLAQALILHFDSRDWMLSLSDVGRDFLHRQMIRYFGDFFVDDCPFSVHKLVVISQSYGRQPGEWLGPASVCTLIREALENAKSGGNSSLSNLAVYVTMDCTIYEQDVLDLCMTSGDAESGADLHVDKCPEMSLLVEAGGATRKTERMATEREATDGSEHSGWRSLILLVPMMLGSETLNTVYIPCIKNLLMSEFCIGIIGGRPKHSLYFIGWQDDRLIYMEPHCCQPMTDVLQEDFSFETFHCSFPRKLPFSKMDPTCAVGFYCKTRRDFESLLEELPKMITQPLLERHPLISFQKGRRADVENGCRQFSDTYMF